MMTLPELAADALEEFLRSFMRRRFGPSQALVEIVPAAARVALECIGNSDALYHNVEHTMLVTLAGHDILRGRHCTPMSAWTTTPMSSSPALPMTLVMCAACSRTTTPTDS